MEKEDGGECVGGRGDWNPPWRRDGSGLNGMRCFVLCLKLIWAKGWREVSVIGVSPELQMVMNSSLETLDMDVVGSTWSVDGDVILVEAWMVILEDICGEKPVGKDMVTPGWIVCGAMG